MAGHAYDLFLSHNWGENSSNHENVKIINTALVKRGYTTWFDEHSLHGNIDDKMAEGIEQSQGVIIFITKQYHDKVNGKNPNDNCKKEFNYATSKKGEHLLVVVMEEEMRNSKHWTGAIGLNIGKLLYTDMTGDLTDPSYLKDRLDALEKSATKNGIVKSETCVSDGMSAIKSQKLGVKKRNPVPTSMAHNMTSTSKSLPPPLLPKPQNLQAQMKRISAKEIGISPTSAAPKRLWDLRCLRRNPTTVSLSWSGGIPPFEVLQTCTFCYNSSNAAGSSTQSTNAESISMNIEIDCCYSFKVKCVNGQTLQKDFPYRCTKENSMKEVNIDGKRYTFMDIAILIYDNEDKMMEFIKNYSHQLSSLSDSTYGYTLLHVACWYNRMNIVKHMLTYGCDVHAVSNNNLNILHICCMYNYHHCLEYILMYITDEYINKRNDGGIAPVVSASCAGSLKCLQHLIHKVDNVEDVKLAIVKACTYSKISSDLKKNKDEIVKILNNKLKQLTR